LTALRVSAMSEPSDIADLQAGRSLPPRQGRNLTILYNIA
jgi:hypothetical protein